jgi:transposase
MAPIKNNLTVTRKLQLIADVKGRKSKRKVAEEYKIGYSTACSFFKNEDVLKAKNTSGRVVKRSKPPKSPNIDAGVLEWFQQHRSANHPITVDLMKEQAKEFAKKFGVTGFTASNGWLLCVHIHIAFDT